MAVHVQGVCACPVWELFVFTMVSATPAQGIQMLHKVWAPTGTQELSLCPPALCQALVELLGGFWFHENGAPFQAGPGSLLIQTEARMQQHLLPCPRPGRYLCWVRALDQIFHPVTSYTLRITQKSEQVFLSKLYISFLSLSSVPFSALCSKVLLSPSYTGSTLLLCAGVIPGI